MNLPEFFKRLEACCFERSLELAEVKLTTGATNRLMLHVITLDGDHLAYSLEFAPTITAATGEFFGGLLELVKEDLTRIPDLNTLPPMFLDEEDKT